VDTYSTSYDKQVVAWAITGLAPGIHTLVIEATGLRSASARASAVWVDAIETRTAASVAVPTSSVWTRVEETQTEVTLTGSWVVNGSAPHSGGTAVTSADSGARAMTSFNGTGVKWIAYRDPWCGIASVYIDNVLQGEIDTYAADYEKQNVAYSITGLPRGAHTLVIEATGRKSADAHASYVWLDAFDVLP